MNSDETKSSSFKKRLQSFSFAINGLKVLVREEPNARIHLAASILVIFLGVLMSLTTFDWIAIWICIGLVLGTEIFNTAMENLCNHISPEKNELIGKVKDLSAAAVLVTAVISLVVGALIFLPKIMGI